MQTAHSVGLRAVIAAAVGIALAAPAAAELYGISRDGTIIYLIDPATGLATEVADPPSDDMGSLAFDDSGVPFAVRFQNNDASLYRFDLASEASTYVGDLGFPSIEGALAYHAASDTFYSRTAVNGVDMRLVTVSATTGAATDVGNMGLALDADVSGMDFLADGTLLAWDPQGALADRILSINTTTGVASVIGATGGPLGGTDEGGLAVDPDTDIVYLSDGDELFTVNPTTGARTLVGTHSISETISGLAFGPREPTGACMIGLDIGTSSGSTLWDIDPITGAGSNPRLTGVTGLGGLAQAPDGTLYAIRHFITDYGLYTLDQTTGTPTFIGSTGFDGVIEGGLDFHPTTGTLYGINGRENPGEIAGLMTLNTTTGAATVVGPIIDPDDETGIDASAMAFNKVGDLYVLKTINPPQLFRLDPSDASVLEVIDITPPFPSGTALGGMEFDDATGVLYVTLANGSKLAIVNKFTGEAEVLGFTTAQSALEVVSACGEKVPSARPKGLGLLAALMLAGVFASAAWVRRRGVRHAAE